jgi:hypothetical protein
MTHGLPTIAIAIALLHVATPAGLGAQLLSPGKLSRPHAELEGIRNCTSCHQLGRSGVSAERCLTCHDALASRIQAGLGYHVSLTSTSCAECHQDHRGEDFALVRLDERSFDHAATGYDLTLSHADVDCRGCHERGGLDGTYLGLVRSCESCHQADSPHGEQFAPRTCDACHDTGQWDAPPAFDHSATEFRLEGLHARVACEDCHGSGAEARFRPLPFRTCAGCHQDPHTGAMAGACSGCHSTAGWHELRSGAVGSSFDHTRTSFALRGAHAAAACEACHRTGRPPRSELVRIAYRPSTASRAYPLPVAHACYACHVDRHAASAAPSSWRDCASCHGESRWSPSAYGALRHAESDFPLTGAHAVTPCASCHVGSPAGTAAFSLDVEGRACADCHAADDPHEGRFPGPACESCHNAEAFTDTSFDHAALGDAVAACSGCHGADDPHGGQFEGRECSTCHATDGFSIPAFDHRATRFALDGAHDGGECVACHVAEDRGPSAPPLVRYRPLGTECTDCHGGDR